MKIKNVLYDQSDIPAEIFASEAAERKFWDTHEFSEEFLEKYSKDLPFELPPLTRRYSATGLRLEPDLEQRIKALAQKKHLPFQMVLTQLVLEEEKRLGLA